LTLAQIRSLPAHGPMRVAAILRVFHDLQEATDVRRLHRDRPIARVERWVLNALANLALIENGAIEPRILGPFFEQVASDLGSAAAKVAWAKLRSDAGVATSDQHALLGQYSRGRIYQLARDAGTVGQLRWTAAFDQLERLLDSRRLISNSIEFRLLDALQGEIARGACSERRARFSKESATPSRFCTIWRPSREGLLTKELSMGSQRKGSLGRHDATVIDQRNDEAIERVRQSLRELRFGEILVVVQDGVAIQVERTEKIRLDPAD
jgi:hypothetical protein